MTEPENVQVDVNGVWFNGKHSWRDFGMFLAERPDTGVPEPKVVTVDVPGANGLLDYSEAAAGYIKYGNRQMTFTFSAMVAAEEQEKFKAKVRNALHGRQVEVVLDEDADWVYNGRATVSFDSIEDWKLKIVVEVDAYPYKLAKRFRTVQLNIPPLVAGMGYSGFDDWELTPEPTAFGSNQTIFKLTRSYYPSELEGWADNTIDLGRFGGMRLRWDVERTPYQTATARLYTTSDLFPVVSYDFSTARGETFWMDLSRFFPRVALVCATQLVIEGIPDCKVFLSQWPLPSPESTNVFAKTVIDVGDMPLIPIVHQNCQNGFQLWCNSMTYLTVVNSTTTPGAVMVVPYPPSPSLLLRPGQNEIVVAWRLPNNESGTTDGKFCELVFREGRL